MSNTSKYELKELQDKNYPIISKGATRYILALNALEAIQKVSSDPHVLQICQKALYEIQHCKDANFEKENTDYGIY